MNSLPTDILNHFSQSKIARKFAIEIGCSDTDLSEFAKNSERELTNALSRGKASAPGEGGICYSVLRLVSQVPGNPFFAPVQVKLIAMHFVKLDVQSHHPYNETKHRMLMQSSRKGCFEDRYRLQGISQSVRIFTGR